LKISIGVNYTGDRNSNGGPKAIRAIPPENGTLIIKSIAGFDGRGYIGLRYINYCIYVRLSRESRKIKLGDKLIGYFIERVHSYHPTHQSILVANAKHSRRCCFIGLNRNYA
jgi:hypothetical protein